LKGKESLDYYRHNCDDANNEPSQMESLYQLI